MEMGECPPSHQAQDSMAMHTILVDANSSLTLIVPKLQYCERKSRVPQTNLKIPKLFLHTPVSMLVTLIEANYGIIIYITRTHGLLQLVLTLNH